MRVRLIVVGLALLAPQLAAAADYEHPYSSHRVRVRSRITGSVAVLVAPPPAPIVVAPRATVLAVPPEGPRPGLAYAPPPVPVEPPPLITAVPIIGPYLDFHSGPPPATALDTYDHRYDYNQ